MFAEQLNRWLQKRGLHYAWAVAAMTFLVMLSSAAALGLPGVLLKPLTEEMGWNAAQISSALALRFLLYGLMAPFSAIFINRFGVTTIVCTALALIASGLGLSVLVNQLWQLFIVWGLMLGIGSGLTALVLAAVVANRWFAAKRGLVIGLLTASAATGQLAFLPLAAWITEHFGWRAAVLPAVALCFVLMLMVVAFMCDRPAQLQLKPFGAAAEEPIQPPPLTAPFSLFGPFRALRSAASDQTFWILCGTFFICGLSTNGLIQTHFISLCGDYGLSALPAASLLAAMGAFDFIGTILSGWLSDRYDNRKLLFWYYGLRGLSLMWLPNSGFGLYGLSTFALFYGLDWIATVPPTVRLSAQRFGPERAPILFGWIFAAHQVGAATAAFGAGFSRTTWLTYTPALYVAGGACLIAAGIVLWVKRSPSEPNLVPASA